MGLFHQPELQLDDHRKLVTEVRILPALEAVRPDLLRQLRALDLVEPHRMEEILLVREREDAVDLQGDRFGNAGPDQRLSDGLVSIVSGYIKRADFGEVIPDQIHAD